MILFGWIEEKGGLNLPQGIPYWVFHSPGGLPTVEIGADGESRWKSQVELW